ncbi:MAG: carboxy terminal-processing peptidase [Proteobacteria bacterium]|nr:carboxy terminal-processing peptidase [Pseudomonadota bacterium]MDA1056784.1 carboxy terminal-processing peptidase [Pseudomonadota bacterium]
MALNQFSKALLLIVMVGCSYQPEDPIDYNQEFQSILTTFDNSSILDLNADEYINNTLFLNFVNKLDGQKIHFLEEDLASFEESQISRENIYQNLKAVIDIFYKRYEESLKKRGELLANHNFDLNIDESIKLNDRERFFTSRGEKTTYLRKLVKNEIIIQMLDGKGQNEAIDELKTNYRDRLSSFSKVRDEDKFGILANNFLSLIDPHSSYFSARDLENWNLRMNLSFEGIGAILGYENEVAKIEELMPGGPAIKSKKINVGDKVLKVGQGKTGRMINVRGWRLDDIVEKIRGEDGSIVRLEIENQSGKEIIELTRGKVILEESDAFSEVITRDKTKIGYINLPSFYSDSECMRLSMYSCKSAANDVQKILRDFKLQDVKGLVFDLRNNGGGFLHEADYLTRLFIDSGPTVQIKDSNNNINVYTTWRTNRTWSKPVVVLVNKFSASASEIFAGALQDYNRAVIMGQETFGKGSVQRFTDTLNGQIKFTDSLYYRVSGQPTQIYGVTPNLLIPNLINTDDYGEKRYENAIKPSAIDSAVYFVNNPLVDDNIEEIHNQALSTSAYFSLLNEIKEKDANLEISLNYEKRVSERARSRTDSLKLINLRREISNLKQFQTYEEYMEFEEEDEFALDAEIDQSINILLELVEAS